jgi:ComEC/Rec2-related protein
LIPDVRAVIFRKTSFTIPLLFILLNSRIKIKMKTMVRRPALTAACCLSAGILWGQHATLPVWVWATVGAVLFLLSLNRSPSGRFVRCSAASCLVLVAWTGALLAAVEGRWFPAGHVVRFACPPRRSVLSGVLIRDPAARNGRFDLLVESDSLADGSASRAIRGRVLISVYGSDAPDFRYGDVVRTSGILSRPGPGRNPGGFDYREWLGRSGIHALLKPEPGGGPIRVGGGRGRGFLRKAVYPCRRFVLSLIDSTVPDPESRSLLRSLTLGDQGLISSDLRDDFSRTGVVHILSVSGSHVGFMFIILSLLMGCLRVPEPFRSAAVAAGLIFYALLTEASAPVVRATVMAVTALAAVRLERKVDPFNTLGLAAFGILLFRPLDLTDPGFQLSFLSVLSILAGYGKFRVFMTRLDSGRKKAVWKRMETVMAGAVVSMSAQAGTLAISARLFNCIPLLSIPANAVAVPISGAILAVSAATVAAAPVHAGLVTAYASLNRFLLTVFIRSIDWGHSVPVRIRRTALCLPARIRPQNPDRRTVDSSQPLGMAPCPETRVPCRDVGSVRRGAGGRRTVPLPRGRNPAHRRRTHEPVLRLRRAYSGAFPAPNRHPPPGRHGPDASPPRSHRRGVRSAEPFSRGSDAGSGRQRLGEGVRQAGRILRPRAGADPPDPGRGQPGLFAGRQNNSIEAPRRKRRGIFYL